MTTSQISGLNSNPVFALTDVTAIDNSSKKTYKTTEQQRFNYFQANFNPATNTVYVSIKGTDAITNGGLLNPYLTIAYAMAQITTATPTNPFTIYLVDNYYAEAVQIKLKPNVSIVGANAGCILANAMTLILDSTTWAALATTGTCYLQNLTLTGAVTLDFSGATTSGATPFLNFNNVIVDGVLTINGNTLTNFYYYDNIFNNSFFVNNATAYSYNNNYNGNAQFGSSSAQTVNGVYFSFSDTFTNPLLVQTAVSATFQSFLTIFAGNYVTGAITVDGSLAGISYDVDSYYPTALLNGATAPMVPLIGGSGITISPGTSVNNQTAYTISAAASGLYAPGTLYGLITTPAAANNTQFGTSPGYCIDSTNTYNLNLVSGYNGDMLLSGVGGLDTGSFAPNTFYIVYLIGDSTGVNPTATIASLGQSGPTVMPPGYNKYRAIYVLFSDALTHLYKATTQGSGVSKDVRVDFLSANIILSGGTSTSQSSIGTIATYLPNNGMIQRIKFVSEFVAATVTDYARVTPHGFNIATNGASIILGAGVLTQVDIPFELEPSASFQIDYLVDHTGAGNSALTLGMTGFTLSL